MFLLVYDRVFIYVNNCCLLVDNAKFNIYIKPIYRQQLNTDIATFLNCVFFTVFTIRILPHHINTLYMSG